MTQKQTVSKLVRLLDTNKQSLLKTCQYLAFFLAWFEQRNKSANFNFYFNIYQSIFHARRLFRLLGTLTYIPPIKQLIRILKLSFTFIKFFELLGKIATALFLALDNVTIISMKMGFVYYKTVRRISHGVLFAGTLFRTIALFIDLRSSYTIESDLKNQLENMTPTELLTKLSQIDETRKVIWVKLLQAFGDFFPTLARTNLPQIIFRTKINKGTVGFFGIVSALTEMYLRNRQQNIK